LLNDTTLEKARTLIRGGREAQVHPGIEIFQIRPAVQYSVRRELDGRPELKYFEAGMDLRLSADPYESFRIFQGRILEQYLAMSTEFDFLVIDANQRVEAQQSLVRQLVSGRINLSKYVLPK